MSHFTLVVNKESLYFLLGLVIGVTFDVKLIIGGLLSYIIYRYIIYTTQPNPPTPPTYTWYIREVVKNIFHPD